MSLTSAQHRVLPAGVEEAPVLVEAVRLAGKDGGEIEAEAIDVHLLRPVAQAVRHHLEHAGVAQVDRVAGAGVVDVVAPVGRQAVVGRVVDALEGKRRPELVAFGGVVVDHVQDHLDAGIVEVRDHLLEFGEGEIRVGGIAAGRGEEADRVVAPVVLEALFDQVAVVHEGVDRQQLDGRDAELSGCSRGPPGAPSPA